MGHPDSADQRRKVLLCLLVLSAVAAFALYHFTGRDYPFYGDELELFDAAKSLAKDGLFSKFTFSDRRPYLFPLILSLVPNKRDLVFAVQLLAFECAAAALFLFLSARTQGRQLWLGGTVIFLNVFALLYLGYALTETFSIVFIFAFAMALIRACEPGHSKSLSAFLAGVAFGCAVMVRPSNLFLVAPLPILLLSDWIASGARLGQRLTASLERLLGFAAGFCLLALPQFHNNLRYYQSPTPVVTSYEKQAKFDRDLVEKSIKYATAISAKSNKAVPAIYQDPFRSARASEQRLTRVSARAAKRVTTLFALIDQDRPIPYNREMTPWYRLPASLLSLAMFFVGLVGVLGEWGGALLIPGTPLQRLRQLFTRERLPALVLGSTGLACLVAFSEFHTEARYGLPGLVLLSCFIPQARALWQSSGTRRRVLLASAFGAWMALGIFLSYWIERDIVIPR